MELRRLGTSGLKVSAVGLGCNNFGMRIDQAQTQAVVDAALEAGITLFDTADIYGGSKSEVFLGEALKGKRDKAVIATKFANPMGEGAYRKGGSRRYIVSAVEASLKRLQTDHIDLYQMHVPDADTPIEETLRALDDLVRDGKVLYLGIQISPAGRLPTPNGFPGLRSWTASSAPRTCSACWSVARPRKYFLPASISVWASCPSSPGVGPAHRQVQAW